ncbi:glycoside hydrolase family 16 protein [Bacillus solimangrovi]|uniref:Laminarinase n=1 Tax=Bacillus solimangrovi TaxID=1305675 RepID=A0A1E5LEJ9_9BACI|nr:glycoside hydrolase family 16 protein [Bacillus solimangrovi]OEH92506.1 laminarinase [Bacillus solimangrovi]
MSHYFFLTFLILLSGYYDEELIIGQHEIEVIKKIVSEQDYRNKALELRTGNNRWKFIWGDEFQDQRSLQNWNLQDWAAYKNEEWQYYTPDNVIIKDGFLIIESKKERFKGRKYTSGAITSQGKFEFTYGKIDIRAKLPRGKGVFPAFWLVNSNEDSWLPEIDIMENLGHAPNELYFVVHWKNSDGHKMRDYFHYRTEDIDFSKGFHKYSLVWEEEKIKWYIDEQPVFETDKFSPNKPLFLYFNTAIGGIWPGGPDPDDDYPKEMLIDYVRVYQYKRGGD